MVSRLALALVIGCFLAGCKSSEEASTQRAAPLTVDQQIAQIQQRTDMPDNIKEQTIESLKQQAAAHAAIPRK